MAKPARSRGESLLAFFRFPFWWSRDRFDNEQRPVRLRAVALHFVPSLLLGPGVGQPLREPRDGGVSSHAPVGDCRNDPRGNEGERSQNADVALAETLAFSNLGQRCDAAEPKLFDPTAGLGYGSEQSPSRASSAIAGAAVGVCTIPFTATKAGASQGSISGAEVGPLASISSR